MITVELFAKQKPSDRHCYAFDVLLDGETIVSNSRDPEHDLARVLLARGIKGIVGTVDGRTGKPRSRVNIERAAKLYVSEEDRDGLRYRRHAERPDSGAPAGEGRIPGTQVPAKVLAPACTAIELSFPQENFPARTEAR